MLDLLAGANLFDEIAELFEATRRQQHSTGTSDDGVGGIAEHAFSGVIPGSDNPIECSVEYGVVGELSNRRQLALQIRRANWSLFRPIRCSFDLNIRRDGSALIEYRELRAASVLWRRAPTSSRPWTSSASAVGLVGNLRLFLLHRRPTSTCPPLGWRPDHPGYPPKG